MRETERPFIDIVLQLKKNSGFGVGTLSGPKAYRPVLFTYGQLE